MLRILAGTLVLGSAAGCVSPDGKAEPRAGGHGDASVVRMPIVHGAPGLLRVSTKNPRYFVDGAGTPVYLAGSHTWSDFQDHGYGDPPPVFDFSAYLDFLVERGHNITKFWSFEQQRWDQDLPGENFWTSPVAYLRTGPGLALDGKPRFDLRHFNPAYFDRLRQRISAAGERGIYVSVMLFEGESVERNTKKSGSNPWRGHPYHRDNNINGVDGDLNRDDEGQEVHRLQVPIVTALQEAYVRAVVDAVGDLDNVIYEISLEDRSGAEAWQQQMIRYVKRYESTKQKQHPIGMTALFPGGQNRDLFASDADWVSPNGSTADTPAADGSKVILQDTDHLCGTCADYAWVWKNLTRGVNTLFMDPYDGALPYNRDGDRRRDPAWEATRLSMGYARGYAGRMNLLATRPRSDLASTGYCLANATARGAEYLVFLPSGGATRVDLRATNESLDVEWFIPSTGRRLVAGPTRGGGIRTFTAPASGAVVLYLRARAT